uniref:Genome polyprotein n=1 Tax=Ginkgo biloba picorna-like virus TaxID=2739851 RepID=A0A6M9BSC6_9VIRU|nr:hypothetical protein 1 [Ginkgo biloba picorna-like virus]
MGVARTTQQMNQRTDKNLSETNTVLSKEHPGTKLDTLEGSVRINDMIGKAKLIDVNVKIKITDILLDYSVFTFIHPIMGHFDPYWDEVFTCVDEDLGPMSFEKLEKLEGVDINFCPIVVQRRGDFYSVVNGRHRFAKYIVINWESLRERANDIEVPCRIVFEPEMETKIVDVIKKKFSHFIGKDKVAYIEKDNASNFYIFDLDRSILRRVNKQSLEKFIRLDSPQKRMSRCVNVSGNKVFVFSDKKFDAEFINLLTNCKNVVINVGTSFLNAYTKMKTISKSLQEPQMKYLLLDILNLMMNIRDGYFTFSKVISTIVSIYTLSKRGEALFNKEMEIGISDIALVLAGFGVPTKILEIVKHYTALSGKRLTDSNLVMSTLIGFFEMLLSLVEFLEHNFSVVPFMTEVCEYIKMLLGYFVSQRMMNEVVECYTQYVKNPQIMFDPLYREKVVTLNNKCEASNSFMTFVSNDSNKYTKTAWLAFTSNVVKFAKNFDSSSRHEPICIVLEGPPGCGKSVLMNNIIELLRKSNKSVYMHTVPPIEAGKDFYDDYENQDVFVMDDVGQKGRSEWSFLINSVSPVKYPLQCASAEKKNTKFFNSKIIICTTNSFMNMQGFTKTDCIAEPEALFRRAHVIQVRRGNVDHFTQNLSYHKFDFSGDKQWKNKFLDANKQIDLPVTLDNSVPKDSLEWLLSLILSLEECRDRNDNLTKLPDNILEDILKASKPSLHQDYFDAQPEWLEAALDMIVLNTNKVLNVGVIFQEWMSWLLTAIIREFDKLSEFMTTDKLIFSGLAGLFLCAIFYLVKGYFGKYHVEENTVAGWRKSFEKARIIYSQFEKEVMQLYDPVGFNVSEHMERTTGSVVGAQVLDNARFSRLIVTKNGNVGHCIVSGNKILAPHHYHLHNEKVDIYMTWEHYENKHKECEFVQLKLVRAFPSVDLAVYQMDKTMPLYKKCRTLFNADVHPNVTKNNIMYALACENVVALLKGVHVVKSTLPVRYEDVVHPIGTGWFTPLHGSGLCGTMLTNVNGDIEAIHVAGSAGCGFMVSPSRAIKSEIRELMLDVGECEFDLDDKVIPNFSGARMRYEKGEIEKKYPVGKTNFAPTKFHKDYNQDVAQVCKIYDINNKGPPIIGHPIKVLEDMSMKTFMHQGKILEDEINFIVAYLDTLIPDFNDITLEEAVFGCDDVNKLNKDSSNGYGCLKNKEDYFDFDNKVIKEIGYSVLDTFKHKCESDTLSIKDVLCTEVFKDELRMSEKRTSPRTFRVMPMPHIVWMKRIFADLVRKLRVGMHEHGMCIGFNPYIDFDVVARKLLKCEVMCDADFGKWDGSLHVGIMRTIHDVFVAKYKGKFQKVLDYLLISTYNSNVLVYDAVYRTTHGLPSGTWLTLVMNCIYNKCLTALVMYRHGSRDVRDVYEVIDYVMGDDKICGASGEHASKFNALTIKKVSEDLGMKCTNGDKSEITKPSRPFYTLDFLKRKFYFDVRLGKYMGALSKDTICNTLQWYDSKSDLEEAVSGKCRSMQIEAFLQDPVFYDHIVNIIKKTAPEVPLFNDQEIINILKTPEGYAKVCHLAGKDTSWMDI